ncbi:UPF0182 family membrane protein [Isachenkonia alkalipeptolytica]|uniref:UPF0182 protein ISALK_12130 n=1 Tax=Isachenkonia alkalipeptolytica TaxID=2565777 RepID=A0AA43XMY3_9CLOT|nr:UPF0182 family protein [Isachenkonia alkalipeptolytica]NBG89239.1 UPF0182 family protein [Isachenkonia alkalipeptolytica]
MKKYGKSIVIWIIGIMVILGLFLSEIINWITSFQWFGDLGYEEVFLKEFITKAQIFLPVFLLFIGIYTVYVLFLKKNYYKSFVIYDNGFSERRVNQILGIPIIFSSVMVGLNTANNLWFEILVFFNRVPYGLRDPIFDNDLGFYLFQLPLYNQIISSLFGIILGLIMLTVIFYGLMFFLRKPTLYAAKEDLNFRSSFMTKFLKLTLKQITVVSTMIFVLLAVLFYFRSFDILKSSEGLIYGAGYTDINVRLPVIRVQMVASLVAAALISYGYHKKKLKVALAGPILILLIGMVGGLIGSAVQQFSVTPNELNRELPYIEHNIAFTQQAYGIDSIEQQEFSAENNLTLSDIQNNPGTIENIRIHDHRPTLETYNQIQAIRLYYRFVDVDIDRYEIEGEYTQVFLGPRELDLERLGENARASWINRHLRFTHGNGAVVSPVNQVTSEGQPEMVVGNIPPSTDTDVTIDRPEIYFGELTDHYIIVNTEEEFEVDTTDLEDEELEEEDLDNFEGIYEGSAGIDLTFGNRFLYAMKNRSMEILLNDEIREGSKIVYDRNIMDRVQKIAPFIQYDEDPYMVINEGRLYWIIDGYTTSEDYPYATPYLENGHNYIRNSVKVVVDAYNGDVSYYISDMEDPIIKTYESIYPVLFDSMEEMESGLRDHVRYPHEYFDLQTEIYRTYHMTEPSVFYDQGDLWNIAEERYRGGVQDVESHYMILRLPEEEQEEFILSRMYTPKDLRNMTAMLVARNDGEHYGELVLYDLPRDRNIYGPMQIENRIDQRSDISESFSLWDQGGSTVIRGNLMVIPIENSILYVEPIYLAAEGEDSIPEVKKVIVAYGDQVEMHPTLEEGLNALFADRLGEMEEELEEAMEEEASEEVLEEFSNIQELIQQANDTLDEANEALREGNWQEYGDLMEELEEILREMGQRDLL